MIKYGDLVQYIKENHVNWNTDLFDVLRGFFDSYGQKYSPPPSHTTFTVSPHSLVVKTVPQQPVAIQAEKFVEPADGEYTSQDLINLLST